MRWGIEHNTQSREKIYKKKCWWFIVAMETNKNEENCKNGNVATFIVSHMCVLCVILKKKKTDKMQKWADWN